MKVKNFIKEITRRPEEGKTLLFHVFLLIVVSVICAVVFKFVSGTPVPLIGEFDPGKIAEPPGLKKALDRSGMEEIDGEKVLNLIENDMAVLLDARTPGEYTAGHIPSAILEGKSLSLSDGSKIVIVYGNTPQDPRAGNTAEALQKMRGGMIYVYKKGFSDWLSRKYLIEKGNPGGIKR